MPTLRILSFIVLLLYVCLFAGYLRLFLKKDTRLGAILYVLLPLTLAAHAGFLVILARTQGRLPLTTPFESMSTLALMTAALYFFIELQTHVRSTGVVIFLFVTVLQGASAMSMQVMRGAPDIAAGPLLSVHVTLALIGYTSFSISFLHSVMYLMLHDEIKSGQFGLLFEKLPSLEQLDALNYRAATAGTVVLVAAIAVGFAWAWTAFGRLPFGDFKVLVTVGAALIYGSLIFAKKALGWGGERIALMSICGFAVVLLSLLGANALSRSFHSFF
jgi:ABC-type transport system involved in cytochrome c biogenesis permease subunit